jgi:hypothetical protein
VPETSSTSCDQAVFVDQATDASVSSDAVLAEVGRFGLCAARILDWLVDLPLLAACLALWWLAGRVPLRIAYLLMRWSFGLAVLVSRGDRAKEAELLALRHENAVLRRHAGRVRYEACGVPELVQSI